MVDRVCTADGVLDKEPLRLGEGAQIKEVPVWGIDCYTRRFEVMSYKCKCDCIYMYVHVCVGVCLRVCVCVCMYGDSSSLTPIVSTLVILT